MSTDKIMTIAREGLKRHALVDQCVCSRCVHNHGPLGNPGRCGQCYDSQAGVVCVERSAYLSIVAELEKMEQIKPDHMTREECPACATQFCTHCQKTVRRNVSRKNPFLLCPKCGGHNLELRGIKHTSTTRAADHRMEHRLENAPKRILKPIFKRLPNGRWGVQGSNLEAGDVVEVQRADGELVTVTIDRIVETNEYGTSIATTKWEGWRD